MKTAKLGFMGETELFTLSTNHLTPKPQWRFTDAEGLEGDPGIIFEIQENPNGGDYIALGTGRKPSRSVTLKFDVVTSSAFQLFQAQEVINSLTSKKELLKLVVVETFGSEGTVTTTLENCRIGGDILTRISGVILTCQFTLIAKNADKQIVIT